MRSAYYAALALSFVGGIVAELLYGGYWVGVSFAALALWALSGRAR